MRIWKRCKKCRAWKEKHSDFYLIKKCRGGYDPQCKECRRATRRENPRQYRPKNPPPQKKKTPESPIISKKLTKKQRSIAESGRCIDCEGVIGADGLKAGAVRCLKCIVAKPRKPKDATKNIEEFAQVIFVDPDYFTEDYGL